MKGDCLMPALFQRTIFELLETPTSPSGKDLNVAVEEIALAGSASERGAIFTKREVVDFILDIIGYDVSKKLYEKRIMEPSFGKGDFLLPIIDRLIISWQTHYKEDSTDFTLWGKAVRGVELHRETFLKTRDAIVDKLLQAKFTASTANDLADKWLIQGDFLLEQYDGLFDYVVGNPPYVRPEMIPSPLLTEYRSRYKTMFDRADIYIPFYERSLSLLVEGGALGFICSDRWVKNRYGSILRYFISQNYHLKVYIDMTDCAAFHSEVSAYPAVTVITKSKSAATRVVCRPKIDRDALASIAKEVISESLSDSSQVYELTDVVRGKAPWLFGRYNQIELIRRIENEFPTLEETGCKVGIGVATGADKVFIGNYETLDVEPDRKLPLVTTHDIHSGHIIWQGNGVINPFTEYGDLVDLERYPRLDRYLNMYKEIIVKRNCAKKVPSNWYRTIDRIWPDLATKPKLLIPDIKGEAHVVFENGKLYPHHNLYYIASETWDLRALQAVLSSSLTTLFIKTYSTKMRGDYLRFQAQYIRRLHMPYWRNVAQNMRYELIEAAHTRNLNTCDEAVFKLYGFTPREKTLLKEGIGRICSK
jgi:hypothetical protein